MTPETGPRPPHSPHTTLAILCGGSSSRFGTDKGLHAPLGDETLLARSIRLLGNAFGEIMVVVRDQEQEQVYRTALRSYGEQAPFHRVTFVHDIYENKSPCPLQEIAIALARSSNHEIIVVPVDHVGVRSIHLTRLVVESQGHRKPVAFASADEFPLPFPSLWRKEQFQQVLLRLEARLLSVRGTLAELQAHLITEPSWLKALEAQLNTPRDGQDYFGQPLVDPFGRLLHYLRFSLTEACNLSCQYCLPAGYPEWYRHKARLDKDAIAIIAQGFRKLGFRKIRFTGGEPTVHPGAREAVQLAHDLGYEEVAMTTNGLLLKDLAAWQKAGLTHLNVSLDSLNSHIFKDMTGSPDVGRIVSMIDMALTLGLEVKVNTVLMRSRNGKEAHIRTLIEWALERPLTLRFIELMDTKLNTSFAAKERVYGHEIEGILKEYGLKQVTRGDPKKVLGGPATDYASAVYPGRIGLINPLSCNFCSACNRLRVTARGGIKLCLFGNEDVPLDLTSPDEVAAKIRQLIGQKPEKHYLETGHVGNVATFRTIGG